MESISPVNQGLPLHHISSMSTEDFLNSDMVCGPGQPRKKALVFFRRAGRCFMKMCVWGGVVNA